jgi:hypothetical protein
VLPKRKRKTKCTTGTEGRKARLVGGEITQSFLEEAAFELGLEAESKLEHLELLNAISDCSAVTKP